jgi:hypothetical protein
MPPFILHAEFVAQDERLLRDAPQPLQHSRLNSPQRPIKRRAKAGPPSEAGHGPEGRGFGPKLRYQKPHTSFSLRACDSTFRESFAAAASKTKNRMDPRTIADGGRGAAACAGATVPRRPPKEVSNPRPSQCGLRAYRVRPALRAVMPQGQQRSPFREPVQRPARTGHPAPATFPERRFHFSSSQSEINEDQAVLCTGNNSEGSRR